MSNSEHLKTFHVNQLTASGIFNWAHSFLLSLSLLFHLSLQFVFVFYYFHFHFHFHYYRKCRLNKLCIYFNLRTQLITRVVHQTSNFLEGQTAATVASGRASEQKRQLSIQFFPARTECNRKWNKVGLRNVTSELLYLAKNIFFRFLRCGN